MVQFNPDFQPNDSIPPELRAKLEQAFQQQASSGLDGLQAIINQTTQAYNDAPQDDIGGFSPNQLMQLERNPLGQANCPIHLADNLPLEALNQSEAFRQMRSFLHALREAGRVKATPKGNLTRAFVEQMVDVFLDTQEQEQLYNYNKVINEEDLFPLHIARLICKLSNLIGITKGHYAVRKKALPLLEDAAAGQLYKQLFLTFFTQYNIGYAYRYGPDVDWLQFELGYLLKPLQKKGKQWLPADKLCQTLLHPMILSKLKDELREFKYASPLVSLETHLLKPLKAWGLIEIEYEQKGKYSEDLKRLRKTKLLDQFVSWV